MARPDKIRKIWNDKKKETKPHFIGFDDGNSEYEKAKKRKADALKALLEATK